MCIITFNSVTRLPIFRDALVLLPPIDSSSSATASELTYERRHRTATINRAGRMGYLDGWSWLGGELLAAADDDDGDNGK